MPRWRLFRATCSYRSNAFADAYADEALPVGEGQTISQPYVVAASAEALALEGHERVLEVGAGTGYQAAVLSLLAREVIAVETIPSLAESARERLARLGYSNVRVEEGDGSLGFPSDAPYDAILVSAAAPAVPQPLVDQLAEGGRLVIPVGEPDHQQLLRIVKEGNRHQGAEAVPLPICAARRPFRLALDHAGNPLRMSGR